jgi:hypothetical protein
LEVWDRREGWNGSGYSPNRELKFANIAAELNLSMSTVANRYRAAFQMITGHTFEPTLWWRLFGPLKYNPLFGATDDILSAPMRRWLQPPVTRGVPDSVISPESNIAHGVGVVERLSAEMPQQNIVELIMDFTELMTKGASDEEIGRELDIAEKELVAKMREQISEIQKL